MTENYADPVDRAVVEQDRLLEEQLRIARKPVHTLAYIGSCHNCSEPLPEPNRFCDADCRDDHAKLQRSRAQRLY
jgi:hypothetical protein